MNGISVVDGVKIADDADDGFLLGHLGANSQVSPQHNRTIAKVKAIERMEITKASVDTPQSLAHKDCTYRRRV